MYVGAGEMAWQFGLLTALTDDPGLALNIHMAVLLIQYSYLWLPLYFKIFS